MKENIASIICLAVLSAFLMGACFVFSFAGMYLAKDFWDSQEKALDRSINQIYDKRIKDLEWELTKYR